MHPAPPIRQRQWGSILGMAGLLALAAGCATLPQADRRALRSIPEVPEGLVRADQALVAAFFAANGIRLTPDQLHDILLIFPSLKDPAPSITNSPPL